MERARTVNVYLSGKITGMPLHVAQVNFLRAEIELRTLGHEPINPLTLCANLNDADYVQMMLVDIEALFRDAKAIYMLDGWGESRGARIEYAIAKELGLEIMFQTCNAAISKAEISNQ